MIRIENLRKEYDAKTVALDDIDLVFEDSTFVALLGPSGCGKTTTLNFSPRIAISAWCSSPTRCIRI